MQSSTHSKASTYSWLPERVSGRPRWVASGQRVLEPAGERGRSTEKARDPGGRWGTAAVRRIELPQGRWWRCPSARAGAGRVPTDQWRCFGGKGVGGLSCCRWCFGAAVGVWGWGLLAAGRGRWGLG